MAAEGLRTHWAKALIQVHIRHVLTLAVKAIRAEIWIALHGRNAYNSITFLPGVLMEQCRARIFGRMADQNGAYGDGVR
jgi:hypothetical protein